MCAKTKIIFICVFLCFSCKEEISLHENNSVIQAKFVTAEKTKNEKDLISFGIISYSVKNDISSQVQGSLQEIFVKDGESVDKNQLLGKLKNIQLEISLANWKLLLQFTPRKPSSCIIAFIFDFL